jgi:hypothetical protein
MSDVRDKMADLLIIFDDFMPIPMSCPTADFLLMEIC